ncbi:MAG: PilZ domain-containing protein [Acidobacteria bacterium]|nr:PilZ domain-containing protein [Acidobacteriota bacterium]
MELRRDQRETTQHKVSVWTFDPDGNIYVQEGRTLDVSNRGACLSGLHRRIEPGSYVGVQNGSRRGRFKVIWSERDGHAHQVGIERVASDADGATRVLLVDNSREAVDSRKPVLQALGYECSVASNASALFELMGNSEYHLLVVSHPLLELDTMEVLVGLRRNGNRLRTVLVSQSPQVHESLRSMADAFVYAREPQSAFIAAVERALDRTPAKKLLVTRSIHRHAVRVPLRVEVLRSGVKTSLHGTSADLSERGIGGNIKAPFTPGEMVKVEFPLPNASSPIEAYAIVRHRRSEFYGFEFLSIDDKSLEIVRSLCAVLPPLKMS